MHLLNTVSDIDVIHIANSIDEISYKKVKKLEWVEFFYTLGYYNSHKRQDMVNENLKHILRSQRRKYALILDLLETLD